MSITLPFSSQKIGFPVALQDDALYPLIEALLQRTNYKPFPNMACTKKSFPFGMAHEILRPRPAVELRDRRKFQLARELLELVIVEVAHGLEVHRVEEDETYLALRVPIAEVLNRAIDLPVDRNAGKGRKALLELILAEDRKSTRLNSSHGYISYA